MTHVSSSHKSEGNIRKVFSGALIELRVVCESSSGWKFIKILLNTHINKISFFIAVSIETDEFEIIPLTPEKVLEIIEQAYPNPVAVDDLAR